MRALYLMFRRLKTQCALRMESLFCFCTDNNQERKHLHVVSVLKIESESRVDYFSFFTLLHAITHTTAFESGLIDIYTTTDLCVVSWRRNILNRQAQAGHQIEGKIIIAGF